MRINKTTHCQKFKGLLTTNQVKLLRTLPKDIMTTINKKLESAPIDNSKQSSDIRDKIINDAIDVAKKMRGKDS